MLSLRLARSPRSMRFLLSFTAATALSTVSCQGARECAEPSCDTGAAGSTAQGSSGSSLWASSAAATGTGGGLLAWSAPACAAVEGTSAVTFSLDAGVTTAASNAEPLTGISYTFGVVALDRPGHVLADNAGELLLSRDAGCTFESLGPTGLSAAALVAAPAGSAYGWIDNDSGLYRFDVERQNPGGAPVTSLTSPSPHIVGLGVDPSRPLEVRLMNAAGQLFQSKDRGETFQPIGAPCPASTGVIYRGAFDPTDLDHVVCGAQKDGAWISTNGGVDWTKSTGLGDKANGFSAVVSPVDGGVVWLEGLTVQPDEGLHVFRSEDGGLTFTRVVNDENGVKLTNGVPLWPHPSRADVLFFEFGTDFQGYGTDLYVYDHALGSVKIHHHDFHQVAALAFSPFDPAILYLGISSEQLVQ